MVKLTADFFPQGLALGDNFCNRVQERMQLKSNIESARPTLVISPRRYGKTSLVLFVLQSTKLSFSHIDLYSELNDDEIQNTVLGSIGNILYSIESSPKKAFKFIADFFSDLNISFKLYNAKISIELSRSKKSPAKTILNALNKLDIVLKMKNKKAIIFFDEFQRISQITEDSTIEGAIRHVAQESKNIVFIFSGSNRHLLSSMFDDRAKPLYKLCDRISLIRISNDDYLPFIQSKMQKKWEKIVPHATVECILNLTENHPYYVNVLCHRLLMADVYPNEKSVESTWHKYAIEEKNNIMNELNLLSANQAKMLIAIAKFGKNLLPMSKDFIALTRFSLSSASQAIKVLEGKDYINTNENSRYFIVDPLIKYVFSDRF
jgi:AAA+ ATPase superfamily predicted ATPase